MQTARLAQPRGVGAVRGLGSVGGFGGNAGEAVRAAGTAVRVGDAGAPRASRRALVSTSGALLGASRRRCSTMPPTPHAPDAFLQYSPPVPDAVLETLRQLEQEGADLRAQIRVANQLHRKRNDLLLGSLKDAEAERSKLNEQMQQLTRDFHVLAEALQSENLGSRDRVQRKGIEGQGGQSRMAYRPSHEYSMKQPTHVCELSHQSLAEMAMLGNHCSRRERLLREVMCVDGVSWGQAHDVINSFDQFNERYYWLETFPYRLGITIAFLSGVASIALVFWRPVAVWYGEQVAGEELPEGVADISELSVNQVGTWTWSWMEPMIGTASFVLLCCQFLRGQAVKMNMRSYSEQLLHWRADRLCAAFPRYDQSMLRAWGKHMPKCGLHFFPTYERSTRQKGPHSGL